MVDGIEYFIPGCQVLSHSFRHSAVAAEKFSDRFKEHKLHVVEDVECLLPIII